jgi:flagellar assembly factor FliW
MFNENSNPFILMNFCGETKLSFMCLDPFYVFPGYGVTLSKEDMMALNVSSLEDLVLLTIVKIGKENIAKGDFSSGAIIAKSPLVINPKNYYAKQISLARSDYFEPYKFKDIKKFD